MLHLYGEKTENLSPREYMEEHFLDLNDAQLTPEMAPQCSLYAILGPEYASLLVVDATGSALALERISFGAGNKPPDHTASDKLQVLKSNVRWNLPFGSRYGVLAHPNTTLVPRRLFQHGDLSGYLKLLLAPGDYVYAYEELPEFDTYLVFATPQGQSVLFSELFPPARQRHLAASLLRYVRGIAGISEHTIFLNLRGQNAQIIVLERQNLLFYNAFQFVAATDLLYFVLLVYDQFRLKPEDTPLTVAGTILRDSELFRTLYRFVREIRFAVPPGHFRFPEDSALLPVHCYVDLLCLKTN